MQRRAFLLWLVSGAAALPLRGVQLHAQVATLAPDSLAVLRAVAPVVLPSELRAAGHDKVVNEFTQWLSGYRSGAERNWGYGNPRNNGMLPIDPARYASQLRALDERAASGGGFAALSLDARRGLVMDTLTAAAPRELPSAPNGQHVITDLMSFFYTSGPAHDLAYRATIRRGTCRGLAGSSARPAVETAGD